MTTEKKIIRVWPTFDKTCQHVNPIFLTTENKEQKLTLVSMFFLKFSEYTCELQSRRCNLGSLFVEVVIVNLGWFVTRGKKMRQLNYYCRSYVGHSHHFLNLPTHSLASTCVYFKIIPSLLLFPCKFNKD